MTSAETLRLLRRFGLALFFATLLGGVLLQPGRSQPLPPVGAPATVTPPAAPSVAQADGTHGTHGTQGALEVEQPG